MGEFELTVIAVALSTTALWIIRRPRRRPTWTVCDTCGTPKPDRGLCPGCHTLTRGRR